MTVVADLDFRHSGSHAGHVYRTGLGRSGSVARVSAPAFRPSGRGYHARSRYSGADCGYSRILTHDVDGGVPSRGRAVAQFVGRVLSPAFRSAVHYRARMLIAGREVGNAGGESGYLYRGHRVRSVSVTELVIIVLSPTFRGPGYDGAGVAASGGYVGRSRGNSGYGSRRSRISSGSFSELSIPVVTPAFHRAVRENRTGEAHSCGDFGDARRESYDVDRNELGDSGPVSELSARIVTPAFDSAGQRYGASKARTVGNLYGFEKVVDNDQGIGLFRGFPGIGSRDFEGRPGVEGGGGSGYNAVRSQ